MPLILSGFGQLLQLLQLTFLLLGVVVDGFQQTKATILDGLMAFFFQLGLTVPWSGAWVFLKLIIVVFRKETLGIDRFWHYILTRLILAKRTFPKGLSSECKSSSLFQLPLPKFFPNSRSRIQQSHLWILVLLFTGFTVLFLEPINKSLEVWLQLLNLGFLLLAKHPKPNQKKHPPCTDEILQIKVSFKNFKVQTLSDFWLLTKIIRHPNSTRVGLITFLHLDHGIALAAVKSHELIQHLLLLCITKILGISIKAWCWLPPVLVAVFYWWESTFGCRNLLSII